MDVIVAVDDELGAVPRQRLAQRRAIDQPLEMPRSLAARRMMDQHDAEKPFIGALIEERRESLQLVGAQSSGRHERRGRQRAR